MEENKCCNCKYYRYYLDSCDESDYYCDEYCGLKNIRLNKKNKNNCNDFILEDLHKRCSNCKFSEYYYENKYTCYLDKNQYGTVYENFVCDDFCDKKSKLTESELKYLIQFVLIIIPLIIICAILLVRSIFKI